MPASTVRYPIEALCADIAAADDGERLRLVFEFVDRWNEAAGDDRAALIVGPPVSTSSRRWDALVAGLVEHLAASRSVPVPEWVDDADRFVDGAWWVIDSPLFRVWALHDTPAALLRHGVMLSRFDLERV
jgi:hypothetical protein